MNVSVGKFFKKMFGRQKQATQPKPKSEVAKKPTVKEAITDLFSGSPKPTAYINKHNAKQYEKAKKRLKNRKKTRAQKRSRIANRKGGQS